MTGWTDAARKASAAARKNAAKGKTQHAANVKQAAAMFERSARGGAFGLNAYRRATGRPGMGEPSEAVTRARAKRGDKLAQAKVQATRKVAGQASTLHPSQPAQRVAGQSKLRAAQNALQAGIAQSKARKGVHAYAPQNKGGISRKSKRR